MIENSNEYFELLNDIKNTVITTKRKVVINANKELISITSIAGRIQATENPRKKYLKGLYGGIPITSDIDFDDVLKSFK